MEQSFGAFLIICAILTITPGADTALILGSALKTGFKGVTATTLGICAGLLFHATLSSLGLSAILVQSLELFSVIKLIGAAYLAYLGLRSLYEAFLKKREISGAQVEIGHSNFSAFRTGLLTNILNPKVAIFYLTFLPQFVDPSRNLFLQSIGLAFIHVLMSFVWLILIGRFVNYFQAQLQKPKLRKSLEGLTGISLLGFGLKLALSK